MRVRSGPVGRGLRLRQPHGRPARAKAQSSGRPRPARSGFFPRTVPIGDDIEWFHNDILMPVIIVISLLVLALLVYVVFRFNERREPDPLTHGPITAPLEIAWTVAPALHARRHRGAVVPPLGEAAHHSCA